MARTRPPLQGGTILITGASSGIGRALARELAPTAGVLGLTARRVERLDSLRTELCAAHPETVVHVFPCDLQDPGAIGVMLDEVASALGPVDVLVNNAGLGDIGLFERAPWEKTNSMLQVNVCALTRLTRELLPGMIARGRGGVLNISSGFGLTFAPGMAAYVGSKHYVTAFTESLRLELSGTGVAVTQVCPGPVATEFEAVAGNPTGIPVPRWLQITPERCARVALRGFACGRALVVPGLLASLLIGLGRLTPRPVLRLVSIPVALFFRRH
jgi:short-subunit dehydrogenase